MKFFDKSQQVQWALDWKRGEGESRTAREERRQGILLRMVREGYSLRRSHCTGTCKGDTGGFAKVLSHYNSPTGDSRSVFKKGAQAGEIFTALGGRWICLVSDWWGGSPDRPDSYSAIYARIG